MLSEKNKSALRSYETRLENERNGPEPTDFEECRHCDDLTEPNPKEGKECGECYNPYGLNEDETHEYHQNQIGDLEKKNKEQAAIIAELKTTIIGYQAVYPLQKTTTEEEELSVEFPFTYVEKLGKRIGYLEKLLRPINLIPDHVLETMTPLEKLVASDRRKGGWCAYCGEYPPIQGFLVDYSCENCIEREPEEDPK